MANENNLIPIKELSREEAQKRGRNGGIASGKTRRRKADFRKKLNQLLTTEIDSPEWTPLLKSIGIDSTLESAVNMAIIKEALDGNVKAYEAIAKYSGQSASTKADDKEQRIRIERAKRARDLEVGGDEGNENIQNFLEAMNPSPEVIERLFDDKENDDETGKNTETCTTV